MIYIILLIIAFLLYKIFKVLEKNSNEKRHNVALTDVQQSAKNHIKLSVFFKPMRSDELLKSCGIYSQNEVDTVLQFKQLMGSDLVSAMEISAEFIEDSIMQQAVPYMACRTKVAELLKGIFQCRVAKESKLPPIGWKTLRNKDYLKWVELNNNESKLTLDMYCQAICEMDIESNKILIMAIRKWADKVFNDGKDKDWASTFYTYLESSVPKYIRQTESFFENLNTEDEDLASKRYRAEFEQNTEILENFLEALLKTPIGSDPSEAVRAFHTHLGVKAEEHGKKLSTVIDRVESAGILIDFPNQEHLSLLISVDPESKLWLATVNLLDKLRPYTMWESQAINFYIDKHIEDDRYRLSAVLVRILLNRVLKKQLNLESAQDPITNPEIANMEILVFGENDSVDRAEYNVNNLEMNPTLNGKCALLILLLPIMMENFKYPAANKSPEPNGN